MKKDEKNDKIIFIVQTARKRVVLLSVCRDVSVPPHQTGGILRLMQIFYEMEVSAMPNIKSAKKRVKVIKAKTLRNKMIKSNLKTVLKNTDTAEDKEAAIRLAMKKVDQAAAKGIIHKNKAARKKSQLAKKLNAAQ